jgi:hypothetical protein
VFREELAPGGRERQRGRRVRARQGRGQQVQDAESGSTLELRNGFYILHLYGNPRQRGLAHGRLLREQIRSSGIASYYGSFFQDLYRGSTFAKKLPSFLRKAAGDLLEWWYYASLEKLFLEETREELLGVAEAAGLDGREALRGAAAPDLMEHLAAGFLAGGKEALGNYYLGGCSALYARGTALRDPAMAFFARNLDFPGALVWKHPLLIFSHPSEEAEVLAEDGDSFRWQRRPKQPYLYLSSAGFPGYGLTGLSASGMALSSHVCLSRNVSRRPPLFLDFNHYLFTRALSVEGVRRLVESRAPTCASPHAAVFADRRQAVAVEVDSRRSLVRPMLPGFDLLVQTNHFLHPLLTQRELEFPLEREHTIGRFRLLRDAAQLAYGRLDAQRMVDLIACNADLTSRQSRLLGDFPCQLDTLTSVVFELSGGDFWVASGPPPGVCHREYRGFNFGRELDSRRGSPRRPLRGPTPPALKRSISPVFPDVRPLPATPRLLDSMRWCTLSQEYLKKGKVRHALRAMDQAIRRHPDPGYLYVRALLELLAGRPAEALEQLGSLRRRQTFPPVAQDALLLWMARCLDLLGRRGEAREQYRRLLGRTELAPQLARAARRGLRRPFRKLPGAFDYSQLGPLEF